MYCPNCKSANVLYNEDFDEYYCLVCNYYFALEIPTRNASLGERRKENMKKKIECPYAQAGSYKLDCTYKGFCLYQEAGAYYPMCGKPEKTPIPQEVKKQTV